MLEGRVSQRAVISDSVVTYAEIVLSRVTKSIKCFPHITPVRNTEIMRENLQDLLLLKVIVLKVIV